MCQSVNLNFKLRKNQGNKMKNILIFIIIFGICPIKSFGQIDRSIEPSPGAQITMELPKIQRIELNNGLRIILAEQKELPLVQASLVIRSGADGDAIGKAGTASLTADMLDEGTKNRSALGIADEIDFLGSHIALSANYDASVASLLTMKENLDKSLELLSDIVLNPTFPKEDFLRLKNELLSDLIAQKSRPDILSTNIFNNKLFGDLYPYGYPIDGTEETVSEITIEDIIKYYTNYYAPNNTSLIISGDITINEVKAVAQKYFGNWKRKEIKLPVISDTRDNPEKVIYILDRKKAPQTQVRLGNIGIKRNSPDFYAVNILNQILGSSNGRLFLNLREAKGYTYGAYSNFSMRKYPGPFLAYAGVQTEVTDSALIEFISEFEKIKNELVNNEEFNMYKTAVIQRLPRIFETPSQIASQLIALELFELPDDFFSKLIEHYNHVTPGDIQRVANKYLMTDKLTIVLAGDAEIIKSKIENLNIGFIIVVDEGGKSN